MSVNLGKMEINLTGTVGVVGPSLVAIGTQLGFVVWEQTVPMSGPSYKYYEVDCHVGGSMPLGLGVIVIEQSSSQNVLMTFGPISAWLEAEAVNAEYVEKFWDFIDSALRQLLVWGFVHRLDPQPPEPNGPTPPLGSNL
jgi:hypothetical protein